MNTFKLDCSLYTIYTLKMNFRTNVCHNELEYFAYAVLCALEIYGSNKSNGDLIFII